MTPTGSSPKRKDDARPLDFHHWLAARGMNPNRRRPPGRTAALLMEYRAYLEQAVGKDHAGEWLEKFSRRVEPVPAGKQE
jgi:hypothetical protein